jgi:prophage DNA circulation protein
LSWSAQAISATGYATRNEAEQAKQAWLALADSLMATAPDALYDQILDLRSAVLQDVAERVVNLPALRSYTPGATLPALVLAHQLYGDATRSQELLERNAIRHPGFVAGGQALEVLDV